MAPTIEQLAQAQPRPWRQIHRGGVASETRTVRFFAANDESEGWAALNATSATTALREAALEGYTHVAQGVCMREALKAKAASIIARLNVIDQLEELLPELDYYVDDTEKVFTPTPAEAADLDIRLGEALREWIQAHPTAVNTRDHWQVRTHDAVEVPAEMRLTERVD